MVEKHSGYDLQGEVKIDGVESEVGQVMKGQGPGNTPVWGYDDYGLSFIGIVTTATDITHFKASALAGFGAGYFVGYRVYVIWDAGGAGAAPQGEHQPISAYDSSDGTFTHTAFTVQLALTDKVLIVHPAIARVLDNYALLANGTYGLAALQALIGAINAATTDSLHGKLGTDTELADYSLYDLLGGNAFKTHSLSTMLGALTATNNLKGILGAYTTAANLKAAIDAIQTLAATKVMGRSQIFEKSITSAANAGDVNVATITTQPCLIESVVIHADAAQTGDMTSCGVFGGAGKVITFISAANAVQAELDAADKQVRWIGAVRLAATKTIVISLVGTGATAVDLTITIKYRACVSGGYLA